MKRIATLGLTLSIGFALAGTASAQVKFGMAGPITGPSAATGAQMKNGVDQAATDINAAGGILGQKIVSAHPGFPGEPGCDDHDVRIGRRCIVIGAHHIAVESLHR